MFEGVDTPLAARTARPAVTPHHRIGLIRWGVTAGRAAEALVSVAGGLDDPYLSINGQLSLKRFSRGLETFRI